MKTFYVYRLTCTHPESPAKYYYGYHSCIGDPRQDPYWSSSRTVQAAMIRFGPEAFTKKVIATYPTRAEALALEVKLHHYFNVKDHPLFFNRANQTSTKFTTTGSPSMATRAKMSAALQGHQVSPETRHKLSETGKGRRLSPEQRAAVAEANRRRVVTSETKAKMAASQKNRSPQLRAQVAEKLTGTRRGEETKAKLADIARNRSPELRAKMAEARRGKPGMPHSEAAKAKIGASQRGKVVSDETRAKIAEAKRGKPGKPASPETKAKMAEAQRQRWAKIRAERDVKRDDDAFGDEAG